MNPSNPHRQNRKKMTENPNNKGKKFSIAILNKPNALNLKASITSAENQKGDDFEIIIININQQPKNPETTPPDNTRHRTVESAHTEDSEARNLAIEHCQGEYIIWLDGNSVLLPDALVAIRNHIHKNNNTTDIIFSTPDILRHSSAWLDPVEQNKKDNDSKLLQILLKNIYPEVGLAIHRSLLTRLGNYKISSEICSSYDLLIRALLDGAKVDCIPEEIHLTNPKSISTNRAKKIQEQQTIRTILENINLESALKRTDNSQHIKDVAPKMINPDWVGECSKRAPQTTTNLNKTTKQQDDWSILLHHHLGLGDHIICNGLVHALIEKLRIKTLFLMTKSRNTTTVGSLYMEHPNIILVELPESHEDQEDLFASEWAKANNIPLLRTAVTNQKDEPFDSKFYIQFGLDPKTSWDRFTLPSNQESSQAKFKQLIRHKNYCLIANTGSIGKFDLDVCTNLPTYEIDPYLFPSLLDWTEIIRHATEIHCIDSAVIHLVDRINTTAETLTYHDIGRGSTFQLRKNWTTKTYKHNPQ